MSYVDVYEPALIVKVRLLLLMVNVRVDELALSYTVSATIEAEMEHEPVVTKVTAPEDEFTVHTEVVELEYVIDPPPAEGVADIVGGESAN